TRGRDDLDDPTTTGQGDPTSSLGRDQLLVADHGDPQAPTGRRAGEYVGTGGSRVGGDELGQAGVVPVEHVGLDRRRVRGLREDAAFGQVDQGRLGERGAEVDADGNVLVPTGFPSRRLVPRLLRTSRA